MQFNYFSCYQVKESEELMRILQQQQMEPESHQIHEMMNKNDEETNEQREEDDDQEEDEPQIFSSHDDLNESLRRSMYYGSCLPSRDRPSLSMTELFVDELDHFKLSNKSLDRITMEKASEISVSACASPTSFLLALVYIERLKDKNPDYLRSVSSADLFLISMMVASKFLNDDGEEDEVFNDEWAASAGLEKNELNKLEIDFLMAIDWRVFVDPESFNAMQNRVERKIALKRLRSRNWNQVSYTDLRILSRDLIKMNDWETYLYSLKLALLGISGYVTSLLTLIGTCYLLNKTPLHPSAHLARLTATTSTNTVVPSSSTHSPSSTSLSSSNATTISNSNAAASSPNSFVIEYSTSSSSESASTMIIPEMIYNFENDVYGTASSTITTTTTITPTTNSTSPYSIFPELIPKLISDPKYFISDNVNELWDEVEINKAERCIIESFNSVNPFLILSNNPNKMIST